MQAPSTYEFDEFRLDVKERLFFKNDKLIHMTPKAFDILAFLIERNGCLVEKNELIGQLWPDSIVEESNLSQNIYLLRKILGEDKNLCYIETVPKRGYRFVAEVKPGPNADTALSVSPQVNGDFSTRRESRDKRDGVAELSYPNADVRGNPRGRWFARRNLLMLSLLLISLTVPTYLWSGEPVKTPEQFFKARSLAVMPLRPIEPGSGGEQLGLGLSDALITKLTGLQEISVRPTSAMIKYASRPSDPSGIGRELGVDAVLEGTVQHVGDRLRVTVQLIKASDNRPIWADSFDEQFTNIFAVQDAISTRVAQALELRLTSEERGSLAKRHTKSVAAYQAYMWGLYFYNKRTAEGFRQSLNYFQQAVNKDPQYALAHAAMSDTYGLIGFYGYTEIMSYQQAYAKAKESATRALELDETLAESHMAMAMLKDRYEKDLTGSEQEIKRALSLNPNNAYVHLRYSIILLEGGKIEDAWNEITQAQELDPVSGVINYNLAYHLYLKSEYDKADEYCRRALETNPDMKQAQFVIGLIYQQKGMYQEAIKQFEQLKAAEQQPADISLLEALGYAYAVTGRTTEAHQMIAQLEGIGKQDREALTSVAIIYDGLGERDRAFALLEASARHWTVPPYHLRYEPVFDTLRADPRFAQLLKRHFNISA